MPAKTDEPYTGSVMTVERLDGGRLRMTDREMVSAGDGVRYEHVPGVGALRVQQNHHMMELLRRRGVPVAYIGMEAKRRKARVAYHGQDSARVNYGSMEAPVSMLCDACEMIPLEVVVRLAIPEGSSHLKRHPGERTRWLPKPVVEFFHKKTVDARCDPPLLRDGNDLRAELGVAELGVAEFVRLKKAGVLFPDPYLEIYRGRWEAHAADLPLQPEPLMAVPAVVLGDVVRRIHELALQAFEALEGAFDALDADALGEPGLKTLALGDIKFELGWREQDQALVLADVCNLDSLRLLRNHRLDKAAHLSKQIFRDNRPTGELLDAYRLGLRAVSQFDRM